MHFMVHTSASAFSQAFARGPDANKMFFVELFFEKSQPLFERLGANSLPFVFHWSPTMSARSGNKVNIPDEAKVGGC